MAIQIDKVELALNLKNLGKNLKKMRLARKENIKEVAKAVNMEPALLAKLEAGQYPKCELNYFFRLQEYYNMTSDELFANAGQYQNFTDLKLSDKALKAINNPRTRRKLMDALDCTEFTVVRYIKKNHEKLTLAAPMRVIRKDTRLLDNELLEERKPSEPGSKK